jgi:hypothetical protein
VDALDVTVEIGHVARRVSIDQRIAVIVFLVEPEGKDLPQGLDPRIRSGRLVDLPVA